MGSPLPLPCIRSSFLMCLLFLLFIFPMLLYLYFISVFATHIVPHLLSCSDYFLSTACTINLCFLCTTLDPPAPFLLLFFPGFVVSINIFLWVVLPSLFLTFSILFQFSYSINHLLFYPFSSIFVLIYLLNLLSPVPTFHPFVYLFLLFHCPMPPHLWQPCNVCTISSYPVPDISWCLSNVAKCNLSKLNTRQCWPAVSTTNHM